MADLVSVQGKVYIRQRELGRGAFGAVWRVKAQGTKNKTHFALKEINFTATSAIHEEEHANADEEMAAYFMPSEDAAADNTLVAFQARALSLRRFRNAIREHRAQGRAAVLRGSFLREVEILKRLHGN